LATKTAEPVESEVEQLQRKIKEYERWFRFLDGQNRILERERQKLAAVLNQTDAGFALFNASLELTWSNDVFRTRFRAGSNPEDIQGASCPTLLCGRETACEGCPAAVPFRTGRVAHRQMTWEVEGETRHIYATGLPIQSAYGDTEEVLVMLQDVSGLGVLERSEESAPACLEGERVGEAPRSSLHEEAETLEAIGRLAEGVAHDFSNLLTSILGHAELLFAQKGKHRNVLVDLHEIVGEVVGMARRKLGQGIVIETHMGADEASVRGDPAQLRQVLQDLMVNAREAMPGGGTIRLGSDVVRCSEAEGLGQEDLPPGESVRLWVSDTGSGISDEIKDRIFEPFFTTKRQGRGAGMGLAMAYGIVRNHGGAITVDSETGRGTTVRITLPRAADISPETVAPAVCNTGSGCILVVDDEEPVRSTAAELLAYLGYEVLEARDGQEAVELFERPESKRRIDLVLLDMLMPRMDGRECFRALRRIVPDLRVVVATGCGANLLAQDMREEGVNGFITKPYQLTQLSEVLASALKS
jgi:signal transduction histidine kinase/CheY-like chemotaxis protein